MSRLRESRLNQVPTARPNPAQCDATTDRPETLTLLNDDRASHHRSKPKATTLLARWARPRVGRASGLSHRSDEGRRFANLAPATIAILLLASSCSLIDNYTGEGDNKPIRESGFAASAEVLEIWDTGVRLNNDPVVGFRLWVTLADGTSYVAETRNVVSIVHIPQVQPGATLPVMVDSNNHELVALDIYADRK